MKKCHKLSIAWKNGIVWAVTVMFTVVLLAGCAPSPIPGEDLSKVEAVSAPVSVGDAAAGLAYIKTSCTTCHSVPDPSTIKPFDEETGRAFLAGHMVTSKEEDLDNMIAYFFYLND